MFVKDYMTRHPIMIAPDAPLAEAQRLMTSHSIRHLPVVADGKRLLGLVTPQRLAVDPERLGSLDVWEITRQLGKLTVKDVMIKGRDLCTITPEATIEEAASLMIKNKISGVPVVDDDKTVIGVITETDLFVELMDLLGAIDEGWRVVVRVPDRKGEMRKIVSAITDHDWGIMALGSVRAPKTKNKWDIVLKVRYCTKAELLTVLSEIDGQEVIDVREVSLADR